MSANDSLAQQWLLRAKIAVKRRLGSGSPVDVAPDGYLVVPVMGQSNAHGAGIGLDRDGLDAPHPGVHQWANSSRSRGRVVLGVDPLFHPIPSRGVGFAVTFAKCFADWSGRSVLLVPCAVGDTSFTPKHGFSWDPADRTARVNLFGRAVASIDAALNACPGSIVAAVLWHQGESDVPLTDASVYAAKLDMVIDGLRDRYGAELPIVLGQMVPEEIETNDPNYAKLDAVHAETPSRKPNTAYVPGPRDSYNSPTETIHYNASGQRELGQRMWTAFQGLNRYGDVGRSR